MSGIFGVLLGHHGRIAEENRFRSPVCGSVCLSLTPGGGYLHHPRLHGAGAYGAFGGVLVQKMGSTQ